MTYAVFVYDHKDELDGRIKAVSLMMLIPEDQLSGYDTWYSRFNLKKSATHKVENLVGYLAGVEAEVPSVTVIKLPKELKTDKHLLTFGESYLGCINVNLKKSELLERVNLLEKLSNNENLSNWLEIDTERLRASNDRFQLTDEEFSQLKAIQSVYNKPVAKWITDREKEIKKELKKYPQFLKRGF